MLQEWDKVIDKNLLKTTLLKLNSCSNLSPIKEKVFKAFNLCTLYKCKVVLIGQDPYPQKGVATGILFGNDKNVLEDRLSPSLKVIKEAVIDYTKCHTLPIYFDNTLESWAKQGVLMLNSSLTTEVNKIGIHTEIWRPFMSDFLRRLSDYDHSIIFVLFGNQAQSYKPCIRAHYILEEKHPAFYARTQTRMLPDVFNKIDSILFSLYGETINWYYEGEQED